MSLELAIERKTAALEKNTAALEQLIVLLTNPPVLDIKLADEEPAPKAKRSKKEAAPVEPVGEFVEEATAPSTEPTATDAPVTEAAAAPSKQLEYADVSEATLRLVKVKGTKHVKDMLAQHGYGTAKDIPMDMWPAWIAACNAEKEIPL
jgi:hypothetical protein